MGPVRISRSIATALCQRRPTQQPVVRVDAHMAELQSEQDRRMQGKGPLRTSVFPVSPVKPRIRPPHQQYYGAQVCLPPVQALQVRFKVPPAQMQVMLTLWIVVRSMKV